MFLSEPVGDEAAVGADRPDAHELDGEVATVNDGRVYARSGAAVEGGVNFLLSGQEADGLWRDFFTPAGEASTWPSAYIGPILQLTGADQHAVECLASAVCPVVPKGARRPTGPKAPSTTTEGAGSVGPPTRRPRARLSVRTCRVRECLLRRSEVVG